MKQQGHRIPRGVIAGIAALALAVGCQAPNGNAPSQNTIQTPAQTVQQGSEEKAEIYLLQTKGNELELVARPVSLDKSVSKNSKAILEQAFQRLLTESAAADASVSTAIPPGTKLRSVTVKEDTVSVDLSQEFTTGGGSTSMQGRLGQVIYTATSLNPNAKVFLSVEGKRLESLGGEGLVIDQPMTRQSYNQDFQL